MSTARSVGPDSVGAALDIDHSMVAIEKDPGSVGVAHAEDPSALALDKDRTLAAREINRSALAREKDRSSLCSFTFADGRHCLSPRQTPQSLFCCFHARKLAQAQTADDLGRDISYLFSGHYLSACDLSAVLGRIFAAVAQGHVKPKTAATLAYLGNTLLQTINISQHEYINAFGTDSWRNTIHSSVNSNGDYLAEAEALASTPEEPRPPAQPEAPSVTSSESTLAEVLENT